MSNEVMSIKNYCSIVFCLIILLCVVNMNVFLKPMSKISIDVFLVFMQYT